ncbi:tRNA (uridine(54)-C5)-methyltransferase TrmA [Aliidiomarina minuta]|uniref:tRNA/tmRNA (uracil-C(5))-methyltransferase n=1 Tax=Aliidiomarina minuta TaxID=880057 RepID=A0A432W433_9GAMM|nr:tRNA (uridine(54)-C5)-methyltransferase TrmA [Aliidiomarina minuta]RUO24110.1 tRNA (uridine(54)-C5)-methyltransferase TrmA [Aliidiomarina minuta]
MADSDTTQASYDEQLADKVNALQQKLAPFNPPALDVYPSPPMHYRMRAEFRVWHEGDDLYYIMFDKNTHDKYRVDQLPAANQLINQLMPALLEYLKPRETLRRKLFQVDFLTTTTDEVVISLLYHRQLDESWKTEAEKLRHALGDYANINLIGRARKQKEVLGSDTLVERIQVNQRNYEFEQVENSFTQPNAYTNKRMLHWAHTLTLGSQGDLLELYCGNGNFSLPLAENFNRVLATEISKSSVNSANNNIARNKIENVTVVRLAAEEVTQAINGEREFRRLQGIDLTGYDCQTVLVDPPRAGLDDDTLQMVSQYRYILYISCNPDTLARNLEVLSQTHDVERAALFDQFPFTEHTEAGVYLRRKT